MGFDGGNKKGRLVQTVCMNVRRGREGSKQG